MEGYSGSLVPGLPRLPATVVHIPLPAGARLVSVDILDRDQRTIPGEYRVEAAAPMTPTAPDPQETQEYLETWAANRQRAYASDETYPSSPVEVLGQSARGAETFARVRFSPFVYRPLSGRLEIIHRADIAIEYRMDPSGPGFLPKGRNGPTPYVIITTDDLASAVDTLVTWKTYIGLPAQVVTDSWISGQYPGDDIQEQVRNFLVDKYTDWGIEYVLIVSDHENIPMRVCTPWANQPFGTLPTDHYYADLTGDWDSDDDGLYGEYTQDDFDYVPEVLVGRIPCDDETTVRSICEKIVAFEADTGDWKNDMLLMGAVLNFENESQMGRPRTDGAELMEQIRTDMDWGGVQHTLYEKETIRPSPYPCDWPLLLYWVSEKWETNDYGLVTWHSHGYTDEALRKYWASDDGDSIPEYWEVETHRFFRNIDAEYLDDDHAGIVFACACSNGNPDEEDNLGRALLENGSSSVIAASRPGYYANGWLDVSDGGIASLDYYFFDALLVGETVGEALFTTKEHYADNYHWWGEASHVNVLSYCLYGDPALIHPGIEGLEPEILAISPASGENGIPVWSEIEITFSRPMKAQTLDAGSWMVVGERSGPHSGAVTYDPETQTAAFGPHETFAPGERVTVILTDAITSTAGYPLEQPHVWTFFTRPLNGRGVFSSESTTGVGGYPSAVAAADLNSDGHPDLAVTAGMLGRLYVRLNQGDGSYSGLSSYNTCEFPSALDAADLDGDGSVDLAVAGDGCLSLLFNDGTGAFPSSVTYVVGEDASAVAIGEIDGDGNPDVVVADESLDQIWVLLSEGEALGAPVVLWAGANPVDLDLADLDADGLLDLVCALEGSDSVAVFINELGAFSQRSAVASGGPSSAVACGDLDGDARIDIALCDPEEGAVRILRNLGGGAFALQFGHEVGGRPVDMAITDFDHDDDLDLVTGNYDGHSLTILLNDGGEFDVIDNAAPEAVLGIAVCDSDGDSDVDLIAATRKVRSNLSILLNDTDITAAEEETEVPRSRLALHQNAPNPFNPVTEIRFELPGESFATLSIYDVEGRLVRRLLDGIRPAGLSAVVWDGTNERGERVASGIYLYRLRTPERAITKKMVMIK
jgi:hypothetical protein